MWLIIALFINYRISLLADAKDLKIGISELQCNSFSKIVDERDKRSLFVGNLSWNVDEGAVGELFEGCKEVRLPKHEDGKIKG